MTGVIEYGITRMLSHRGCAFAHANIQERNSLSSLAFSVAPMVESGGLFRWVVTPPRDVGRRVE